MLSKKKIIFNASCTLNTPAGISRYCKELSYFIKNFKNFDTFFFLKDRILKNIPDYNLSTNLDFKKYFRKIPFSYQIKFYLEKKNFVSLIRNKNFNIYHETNLILKPFNGTKIITVFDLSWDLYEKFHPKERVDFLKTNFRKSISSADAIITISNVVKKDLENLHGISSKKIFVTHLGYSKYFSQSISEKKSQEFFEKFKLNKNNYFLTISTLEPRKNLISAIEAYSRLDIDKNLFHYVIVGSLGWDYNEILKKINNTPGVKLISNPTYTELALLMQNQKAHLYPSFSEGFGLPVLESMSLGKPVIASAIEVIKEVAKNSVLFINPKSVNDIKKSLEIVLTDNKLISKLSLKGKKRSKDFSWEKCAKQTSEVYLKFI
jgi:alpha-1,3-rhamnosyl/mannosyltransferase